MIKYLSQNLRLAYSFHLWLLEKPLWYVACCIGIDQVEIQLVMCTYQVYK